MNKKLIIFPLFLLILISSSLAYFPDTHTYILQEACSRTSSTPIRDTCCNNLNSCITGMMMPDIAVVYYLTEFEKYEATHSPSFCLRMVDLAKNKDELAFAYGICLHLIEDSGSHNYVVPHSISNTLLPNVLIHPLAEEKINDKIKNAQIEGLTRASLSNYQQFVPIMKSALLQNPEYQDKDIPQMMDFLVGEIQGGSGYQLGWSSLFAVPIIIYIVLILLLILSLVGLASLIKRKNKTGFNKFSILILILIVIFVLIAFIGVFTGTLFKIYQVLTTPFTAITPTGNVNNALENSIQNVINFFNTGQNYILNIKNPTGIESIKEAEGPQIIIRYLLIILLIGFIIYFIYTNFFKKKKKRR